MKSCTRCKLIWPLEAFPKNKHSKDGRASRCNACMREVRAAYLATETGKLKRHNSQRKYQASDKGQATRAAYARTPKARAQRREYAKTAKGKLSHDLSRKKWRARIRETREGRLRTQAITAVRDAVRRGDLAAIASCFCKQCEKPAAHYHHDLGYERRYWLHIVPLCIRCHEQIHHPLVD